MKYRIINLDCLIKKNEYLCIAECPTREIAEEQLKKTIECDNYLKEYYGWKKTPTYKIIEVQA